jgi:hypothetical protein
MRNFAPKCGGAGDLYRITWCYLTLQLFSELIIPLISVLFLHNIYINFVILSYFYYKVMKLLLIFVPCHVIQDVPGGEVNILGGHSIDHSKQKGLYVHVSYSERFPR